MINEIIANWLSKSDCHAWFDIDGTIKHADKKYPQDKIPCLELYFPAGIFPYKFWHEILNHPKSKAHLYPGSENTQPR